MKIYVSGRGDIFEKERIAKGYAECYVNINGTFYCCNIFIVEALKKQVNIYAKNAGSFVINYTNTIVVKDISDAGIKNALVEAEQAAALQCFGVISLLDLDELCKEYVFQNSDQYYTDCVINNHLLRYEGRLFKFTVTKYNESIVHTKIIGNIYDNNEKLEEIVALIDEKGYLERYKPYFDITITELHDI